MIPPSENRAFDRSIITQMLKGVASMLARDTLFATACSDIWVMESGDVIAKFREMLSNRVTVAVMFDTWIAEDEFVWVARISVRCAENVVTNRTPGDNRPTSAQLAESAFAILHESRIPDDKNNWSKLLCKQMKMEGFDEATNLLVYSLDIQLKVRPVAVTIEES